MTTYGLLWSLGGWLGIFAMMFMLRVEMSDFCKPREAFSIIAAAIGGFLLWPLAIPLCLWIETKHR